MHWFLLDLNPEPWAIGPVGYSRRGGKMSAYVGRNQQLDAYKEAVREEVAQQFTGELLKGPIELVTYFWRNRAEYTTPQARTHRKHEADLTNLVKATEDALQGVVFANDRDVVLHRNHFIEQSAETKPCIIIGVRKFEQAWPDLLAEIPEEIWSDMHSEQPIDFDDDSYRSIPEDIF